MLEYRSSQLGSLLDAINNERLDEQSSSPVSSESSSPHISKPYRLASATKWPKSYSNRPPSTIDDDSDCKFGAALADALAYAEDPGHAEALSRILEDCIGSEPEEPAAQ